MDADWVDFKTDVDNVTNLSDFEVHNVLSLSGHFLFCVIQHHTHLHVI